VEDNAFACPRIKGFRGTILAEGGPGSQPS
jgi:hypothetical protein